MSEKIKICVVGDRNAGKTIFCNLIAGQFSDPAQLLEHRRPTASLRVLEFEHEIDSKTSIDVELWDCSGDPEQEKIWPSFRHSCGGVIIFSRDTSIESFVDYFVESGAVQPEQSLLWINKEGGSKVTNSVIPDVHQLDVLSDIESSKSKFAKFLRKCAKVESEVQDRDERRIAA